MLWEYIFICWAEYFQELDKLEEGANVYKLIGPALVKQDIEEAKQTVQKRIDYINSEL